jgi:hypothetical protein
MIQKLIIRYQQVVLTLKKMPESPASYFSVFIQQLVFYVPRFRSAQFEQCKFRISDR